MGSGGHGPLQPADPAHLGGEFLHLPVALSQREPLGVVQNQPWLPQTHPQTEDRVELKVMKHACSFCMCCLLMIRSVDIQCFLCTTWLCVFDSLKRISS